MPFHMPSLLRNYHIQYAKTLSLHNCPHISSYVHVIEALKTDSLPPLWCTNFGQLMM